MGKFTAINLDDPYRKLLEAVTRHWVEENKQAYTKDEFVDPKPATFKNVVQRGIALVAKERGLL
jgi:Fe-S-cluster formation regulator IscX/YfhJ